jgi:hypothetical protein
MHSWFQSNRMSASGALRNDEWQAAAAGTPDPGKQRTTDCNVNSATIRNTGSRASCKSSWGVFDTAKRRVGGVGGSGERTLWSAGSGATLAVSVDSIWIQHHGALNAAATQLGLECRGRAVSGLQRPVVHGRQHGFWGLLAVPAHSLLPVEPARGRGAPARDVAAIGARGHGVRPNSP